MIWKKIGNIRGERGQDGKDGVSIQGPPGRDGRDAKDPSTVHYSILMPKDSLGNDNDWCFCETNEIFRKVKGKWEFYKSLNMGSGAGTGTGTVSGDFANKTLSNLTATVAPNQTFEFTSTNTIRLQNDIALEGRNEFNSAWKKLIRISTSGQVIIGDTTNNFSSGSLIPTIHNTYTLGSAAFYWSQQYSVIYNGGGSTWQLSTTPSGAGGVAALSGNASFPVGVITANRTDATASSPILIESGNNSVGNSGDVRIRIGTSGATRGKFVIADGTEGTAGRVWKSVNTSGGGAWSQELITRAEVAVVWPDGSGTHASIAAAIADASISVIYCMPNLTGPTYHTVDNSAGPIAITRKILFQGIGTEEFIDIRGNTPANNLFAVSGSGAFFAYNISFSNCATVLAHTGAGRIGLRRCEFDGLVGVDKVISTTHAASDVVMQDCLVLFCASTAVEITNCDTVVIEGCSFILNSATVIRVDATTTSVNISSNNFFSGVTQLDINGGTKVISRSNTYDTPGAGGAININGASGSFQSQGDVALAGVAHIIIDAANAMTYRFRNGSFDLSKVTRPSGQVRLQNFVDENASLFCSTLKAFTDSSNTATTTIATSSTSLGTNISGVGSKTLNLSPSSGAAVSVGTIVAGSGQTASVSITGAGGLNNSSIILSGASAISGTISQTGQYNKNFGDIRGSTTLNGSIALSGVSCFNGGSIEDGGTITYSANSKGATFQGILLNGGAVTMNGSGFGFGSISGASASMTIGAANVGAFGTGTIVNSGTGTLTINSTGSGAFASGSVNCSADTAGTIYVRSTGAGSFAGGYVISTDLTAASSVINSQILASGQGTFAQGYVLSSGLGGSGYNCQIIASTTGAFAQGFIGTLDVAALISASGAGALARGRCGLAGGTISATGPGSSALGNVDGGVITSTGNGSFAHGFNIGPGTMSASGNGAACFGTISSTGSITASGGGSLVIAAVFTVSAVCSGINSMQLGPGTNAQNDSLQVGILGNGVRLIGVTTAPTTPTNGDIRQNSSGIVQIYSNSIERNIQKLQQNTNFSVTQVGNVGTGVDDLISLTFAANQLTVNGDRVVVRGKGSFAANANNKQVVSLFGGTQIVTTGAVAINGGSWESEVTVTRTGAATQIAWGRITVKDGAGVVTTYLGTASPTATLSSSVIIKWTGEATSNNDITQEAGFVEIVRVS